MVVALSFLINEQDEGKIRDDRKDETTEKEKV